MRSFMAADSGDMDAGAKASIAGWRMHASSFGLLVAFEWVWEGSSSVWGPSSSIWNGVLVEKYGRSDVAIVLIKLF